MCSNFLQLTPGSRKLSQADNACPREIVPRGGHPLELIEYIIERVYQVFLSFEPFEFVIVHKSEGWAPP
jgi:hypothetical protein